MSSRYFNRQHILEVIWCSFCYNLIRLQTPGSLALITIYYFCRSEDRYGFNFLLLSSGWHINIKIYASQSKDLGAVMANIISGKDTKWKYFNDKVTSNGSTSPLPKDSVHFPDRIEQCLSETVHGNAFQNRSTDTESPNLFPEMCAAASDFIVPICPLT